MRVCRSCSARGIRLRYSCRNNERRNFLKGRCGFVLYPLSVSTLRPGCRRGGACQVPVCAARAPSRCASELPRDGERVRVCARHAWFRSDPARHRPAMKPQLMAASARIQPHAHPVRVEVVPPGGVGAPLFSPPSPHAALHSLLAPSSTPHYCSRYSTSICHLPSLSHTRPHHHPHSPVPSSEVLRRLSLSLSLSFSLCIFYVFSFGFSCGCCFAFRVFVCVCCLAVPHFVVVCPTRARHPPSAAR